jgi:tripartite-type tricarboxylate transporter receptor subunit TctC
MEVATMKAFPWWAAVVCCALTPQLFAQAYPVKPIRIIVPYPAGGTTDLLTRAVGQKLTAAWGQPVITEYRTGASGMIGAEAAARATADGYTLIMAYVAEMAIMPNMMKKLSYDPQRDLAPITLGAVTPMILVTHPSLPVKSVREFVALARARPGELPYASAGNGSPAHLAFEWMQRAAKISNTHVPYKGAAPALIDLLGGHVAIYFSGMPPAMPHVRSGRLRALAVSTAKRSPAAPEVPAVAEAGIPGFDVPTWFGMLAPAAVPRDIIARLNGGITQALKAPDVREQMAREGAETSPTTPEEFGAFIRAETEKFAKIVREAGLAPQ